MGAQNQDRRFSRKTSRSIAWHSQTVCQADTHLPRLEVENTQIWGVRLLGVNPGEDCNFTITFMEKTTTYLKTEAQEDT